MLNKPFELLCQLVDTFYQEVPLVVKPGRKPDYEDDWYLKLYFFGLLNRCPEKGRFLPRAQAAFPQLFKKNLPTAP